jgi:hypothetical protein
MVVLNDRGVTPNHKALPSLTLLAVGEIWNERNAWVFHTPMFVILDKIKKEARLLVIMGAKHLGKLMPTE